MTFTSGAARAAGLAAVLAATTALTPAVADTGRMKLTLGGYANFTAAYVDQDESAFDSFRDVGFAMEAEVHVRGKVTLDNGLHVGFRAEIELANDNPDGFFFSGTTEQDLIDEVYVFVEDWWGRVEFGSQDGAADQLGIFSPSVARGTRVNDGEISFLQDGNAFFSAEPFAPILLRTDLYASDDNLKIVYFTPRIGGFQAGVSFTPEATKGFSGFSSRIDDEFTQQGEFVEAAITWQGQIHAVDLAASVQVLSAHNERPDFFGFPPGFDDDLFEWGFGLNVGFNLDNVRVVAGGSFKETNATGNSMPVDGFGLVFDDADTQVWELGVVASRGPWQFGASYIEGTTELLNFFSPTGFSDTDGRAFEFAVGYILGPGVQMTLGYQNHHYEEDPAAGFFYTGDNEVNANVVYFETALSL